jgi:hypothetical protein
MKNNMDFYTDKNKSILASISQSIEIPEDVLQKKANERLDTDMSDNAFGDPANKLWPVDSRADTWLSLAYFTKTASSGYPGREKVKETLRKAASLWEIPYSVVTNIEEALTPAVPKQAAAAAVPVATEGQSLLDNASKYTYASRLAKAEMLLKRAGETGEILDHSMHQSLERMAAQGRCSAEDARAYAKELTGNCRNPLAAGVRKIAAELDDNRDASGIMVTPMHLAKLACASDILLRGGTGYRNGAGLPEDRLFTSTDSFTQFLRDDALRTTGGQWVSKAAAEKQFDNLSAGLEEMGMDKPDNAAGLCARLTELTPVQLSRLDDCAGVPFINL